MQVHSDPLIALVVVCTVCPLPSATLVVPTTPWAFLMRAIENTMELSDEPELNWLAILNYAREELRIHSEYSDKVMDLVERIPDTGNEEIIELRKEVIDLNIKRKQVHS